MRSFVFTYRGDPAALKSVETLIADLAVNGYTDVPMRNLLRAGPYHWPTLAAARHAAPSPMCEEIFARLAKNEIDWRFVADPTEVVPMWHVLRVPRTGNYPMATAAAATTNK